MAREGGPAPAPMRTWADIKVGLRLRLVRDTIVNGIAAANLCPRALRLGLMRLYGIRSETVWIWPGCFFESPQVAIGRQTFVNYGCLFDSLAPITIGEWCRIGQGVALITSTHLVGPRECRAGEVYAAPIQIGNGVWVGARAVILPGVTVGNGCVIAAGAVVREDCDPDGLYAGVPAERVRELPT